MVRNNCFLNLPRIITDCPTVYLQVSNPSMQFMLYETMLKKLKRKRALVKQGGTGVTALEVSFHSSFFSSQCLLFSKLFFQQSTCFFAIHSFLVARFNS